MNYYGHDSDGNIEILLSKSTPINVDDFLPLIIREGSADPTTQYFDVGLEVLASKSVMSLVVSKYSVDSDGLDTVLITNIPNPSKCFIQGDSDGIGQEIEITDGSLEFTTETSGLFTIVIGSVMYIAEQIEVTAL